MNRIIRYPRTMHVPRSNSSEGDLKSSTVLHFANKRVVITEKMDGENTSMYSDYIHARSLDSRSHPSRDWVKRFWAMKKHLIPEGWRICGENVYAKHSIYYQNLETYFYGFSVWNEENDCLSWNDTLDYFHMIGVTPVKTIFEGTFNLRTYLDYAVKYMDHKTEEGFVIRCTNKFNYFQFHDHVAKYVRRNHIQCDQHWFSKPVTRNKLIHEAKV